MHTSLCPSSIGLHSCPLRPVALPYLLVYVIFRRTNIIRFNSPLSVSLWLADSCCGSMSPTFSTPRSAVAAACIGFSTQLSSSPFLYKIARSSNEKLSISSIPLLARASSARTSNLGTSFLRLEGVTSLDYFLIHFFGMHWSIPHKSLNVPFPVVSPSRDSGANTVACPPFRLSSALDQLGHCTAT